MELEDHLPKESWLRRWMELWPLVEAPRSYILFAGMSMIGAMIGRSSYLEQDARVLYPMLNMIFCGPSGIGKSTAIELGFKLLTSFEPKNAQPQLVVGAPSPEKLHFDLAAKPHAVLFASELANFFSRQKYMEGMIPYITELLDYKERMERRTFSQGLVELKSPQVTIIGGSTVEWLQEQLPDSATTGGFLSRFLLVFEESKSQLAPLPNTAMGASRTGQLRLLREETMKEYTKLIHEARGIVYSLEDYEAIDCYTQWYTTHRPVSGLLRPFAERAGEFVQRLALLSAISSYRDSIGKADILAAIGLYSEIEQRLNQIVVPFTTSGKYLKFILDLVGNQEVEEKYICRGMRNYIDAFQARKLIESLISTGELVRQGSKIYRGV